MALTKSDKIVLISACAPPFLTFIIDWLKGVPVLTTLLIILKSIWSLFETKIPLWAILLALVLIVVIFILWAQKIDANKPQGFSFLNYKEDHFDNIRWTWDYEFKSADNKYHIHELRAYCPQCDSILRGRAQFFDATITECVRCDLKLKTNLYADVYLQKIQLLIIDNIQRQNKQNVTING